MLFVLYFDCNRHAFAILYNDAVMKIKKFITITITTTTATSTITTTTTTTTSTTTTTTTTITTNHLQKRGRIARTPHTYPPWTVSMKAF